MRHDRDVIEARDIDEARDRIILGQPRRLERPAARGEALGRGPRDGPRPRRGALRARRPGLQDHDPSRRAGARGHRAAAASTSGTSTRRATCATRSRSASAAGRRRSSSSARPRRAPRATSAGRPSSPSTWCGTGACPPGSGRSATATRAPGYLGGSPAAVAAVLGRHPARHRRGGEPSAGRGRGACPHAACRRTATSSTPSSPSCSRKRPSAATSSWRSSARLARRHARPRLRARLREQADSRAREAWAAAFTTDSDQLATQSG